MAGKTKKGAKGFQESVEPDTRIPIDWVKARLDYEVGLLNPLEISRKFKISSQAVYMRKKKEQWNRSLNDAVRNKTSLLLAEELVDKDLSLGEQADAQQILDAAAALQYEKTKHHRSSLTRLEQILERHMEVLETGSYSMTQSNGKALIAVIDIQESTRLLSAVARTLAQQITLERQSYGMDSDKDSGGSVIHVSLDLGLDSTVPADEIDEETETEDQ